MDKRQFKMLYRPVKNKVIIFWISWMTHIQEKKTLKN